MRSTSRGSRARSRTSPGEAFAGTPKISQKAGFSSRTSAAGVGDQHALGHAGDGGAQVIALRLDGAELLAGVRAMRCSEVPRRASSRCSGIRKRAV